MWATTGNHGHQWTYANVILSHPTPFRVTFQGEVGGDMWTNIAVDDVSFTPECLAGGAANIISLCFFLSLVSSHIYFLISNHDLLSFPLPPHLFCLLMLMLMLMLLLAPFPCEFSQPLVGNVLS